jgi:hypothetical protein
VARLLLDVERVDLWDDVRCTDDLDGPMERIVHAVSQAFAFVPEMVEKITW